MLENGNPQRPDLDPNDEDIRQHEGPKTDTGTLKTDELPKVEVPADGGAVDN